MLLKELQSLALDVKVLTENNEELVIREFEDDDTPGEPRREEAGEPAPDFDFGIDEEEEDDEGFGSLFDDEAGDDEDFVSDDLFGDKDLDEDDLSDVEEEFSLGDLFGDDDKDE